jgi:hypothetical protein
VQAPETQTSVVLGQALEDWQARQVPLVHVWPPAQLVHTLPLAPHWETEVCVTHVVPAQHPAQFDGPQLVVQTPCWHT